MFTGIIEAAAKLVQAEKENSNVHFTFEWDRSNELRVDQSLAHNGVCLTVVKAGATNYSVTAIGETLKRTNLSDLAPGQRVNLERCMPASGRFDGHIVQGHVDCTGNCESVTDLGGSWEFVFSHPVAETFLTVPKGSITINGVSLTVVQSEASRFSVHVIPYTFENTNFRDLRKGDRVNLEFDIVGKYVARLLKK